MHNFIENERSWYDGGMKVVKNNCYGVFRLSARGLERYAELKGKRAYFFKLGVVLDNEAPMSAEEVDEKGLFWIAFSVPNPNDYRLHERDEDGLFKSANAWAKEISFDYEENRSDPALVQVVEELGKVASGRLSELVVVDIPDDVEYEIDDYDGLETIREKHRTW